MNKKLYKKYSTAINSGLLLEGEIRGLKRQFSSIDLPWQQTKPDAEQVAWLRSLHELIDVKQPKVTQDQCNKGLQWLKNQAYTPLGKVRKNCQFNDDQLAILKHGSYFTLVEFEEVSNGYRSDWYPVYRLFDDRGNNFSYLSSAWQSGIKIEVYNTNYVKRAT